MILIADSGSTKTQWCIVDHKSVSTRFETIGLNPFFVDTNVVIDTIKRKISTYKDSIKSVYFYGAGCSGPVTNEIIYNGISRVLPKAEIKIYSDILGAAHALFGNDEGIAVILGTGQSTCHYKNEEILFRLPSTGFILGDEGSGANLGLRLLKAYIHHELPEKISKKLSDKYQMNLDAIKKEVYTGQFPNRYFASFAPFVYENRSIPEIKKIIEDSFNDLFNKYILKYPEIEKLKIGFVGSVAFYFKDFLTNIAAEKKLKIHHIIQSPIDVLIKYHLKGIST